jgi:tRNA pseudouridine38-40 synthase
MRTFKLTLSYDGTNYCGWQVQPNGVTIQEKVQQAFAQILGHRVSVVASGRTDAGVHAMGQVASCILDTAMTTGQLLQACNSKLPDDIRVLNVEEAVAGFHAVRDAVRKRYRYVIQNGRVHNVFRRNLTWFVYPPLAADRMHAAGQALVGRHDYRSFQAAGSRRRTTERTIFELIVKPSAWHPDEIVVEIEADGFLYNMARNIVGTLVDVGRGAQTIAWPAEVLAALDRRTAGRTAPPQGLYLLRVDY